MYALSPRQPINLKRQPCPHWFAVAVVVTMTILTACASRAGQGEVAASNKADDFILDLPTIIIDLDSEANASIAELPLKTIVPGLTAQLPISAVQIQQLTAFNIQHIQINNRDQGIDLLVNGLSLPSARWTDGSLMAMLATLDLLDVAQVPPAIADLLPHIQQLGVAVVLRFPLQADAQALPLYNNDPNSAAVFGQRKRDQFLAAVGRTPVVRIPVRYAEDGTWRVNGITENEYLALLPAIPWNALHLSRASIQSLHSAGISQLDIAINQAGISVSINNEPLPYIGWSEGELQNLIVLVEQMGLLEANGVTITPEQRQFVVETLLPMVQASDVSLRIYFP